jgi:murein DD-endopeptidase MepM/ murein hydrolase activator NlpD
MRLLDRHPNGLWAALLVVLVVATVAGTVVALVPALADTSGAGAEAALFYSGGAGGGVVAVQAAATANTATVTDSRSGSDLSFTTGTSSASSYLKNGDLESRSQASLQGVSLLDGVVKADRVTVEAVATVNASQATASGGSSAIVNLWVEGVGAVDAAAGSVTVPGVGTLAILSRSVADGSGSASAQIVGLRLTLTEASHGLPAGTVLVAGRASARADEASWKALTGTPTTSASPTKTKSPKPTATATPKTTPPPATTQPPATQYTTPTTPTTYPPMSTNGSPDAALLARFPGAIFPVVGTFYYTDDWQAPRVGHLHQGNDVFATYGSPAVAVQNGVITNMSTDGLGGNALHVLNDRGDYFYYAHFSAFAPGIADGVRVQAGQTIGYVGQSGNAQGTPPHLHFEVHPGGGTPTNPYPYLNAWRASGAVVSVAADESGQQVTSSFDPDLLTPEQLATAADSEAAPSTVVAVRVQGSLATLNRDLAVGAGSSSPGGAGSGLETFLALSSTVGLLAFKKLQLAGLLLP